MGRIYRAASLSNRAIPSRASRTQVSTETVGFRKIFVAESLTRAQWSSRSGVTPSKARAPSNTIEQSQAACVRGPMIGTLPSCQSPSRNVQVLDQPCPTAIRFLPAYRFSGFLGVWLSCQLPRFRTGSNSLFRALNWADDPPRNGFSSQRTCDSILHAFHNRPRKCAEGDKWLFFNGTGDTLASWCCSTTSYPLAGRLPFEPH